MATRTSTIASTVRLHTPRSALQKLTALALVGIALVLVYIQVGLLGAFDPALTGLAGLGGVAALLIIGVPFGGWRWTPLLGTLLGAMVLGGNSGPIVHDLTHPELFKPFALMLVAVPLALICIGAGLAATVQNYRRPASERHTPRYLANILIGLAMVAVGAGAVGALPRSAGLSIDPQVLAELPALTTPGFRFDHQQWTAKAGETVTLRLDNPTSVPHSFDIDELNVHVLMPTSDSSIAIFRPTAAGTYTYYCKLPGHREAGMVGTLVVEP